jgi:hypothetical protein
MADHGEVEQQVPSWAATFHHAYQYLEQRLEVEKLQSSYRISCLVLLLMVAGDQVASHRHFSSTLPPGRVSPTQPYLDLFDGQSSS